MLKNHAVAPLSEDGTPSLVSLKMAVADPLVFAAAPNNSESVAAKAFRSLVDPHLLVPQYLELVDLHLCWHSDSGYHI